jgi:hypothetical protein
MKQSLNADIVEVRNWISYFPKVIFQKVGILLVLKEEKHVVGGMSVVIPLLVQMVVFVRGRGLELK